MGSLVNPRASVGILVNENEQLLFALRSPTVKTFPKHWEFPGGALVKDESFLDALHRELNEELGISLKGGAHLLREAYSRDDRGRTWLTCTYICPLKGEEPRIREPEKCSQIGFFDPLRPPAPLMEAASEDLRAYQQIRECRG